MNSQDPVLSDSAWTARADELERQIRTGPQDLTAVEQRLRELLADQHITDTHQ